MKAVLTGLFVGAFVGWLAGYFGQLAFVLDRDTPVAGIAVSSLLALVSPLTFAAAAAGALVGICLVPIIVLMSRKRGVGAWGLITVLTFTTAPAMACDGWDACEAEIREWVIEPCTYHNANKTGLPVEVVRANSTPQIHGVIASLVPSVEGMSGGARFAIYKSALRVCIGDD